jgi:hypothetical protein
MTLQELKHVLSSRGLRKNTVSFDGRQTAPEQFFIINDANKWEVYYFERGNKNRLRNFIDESSACEYLLELLMNDKTSWQR